MKIAAFTLLIFLFATSCGSRRSSTNTSKLSPEKSSEKTASTEHSEPIFLKETFDFETSVGSCRGVFVSKKDFIAPSHCWQNDFGSVLISGKSHPTKRRGATTVLISSAEPLVVVEFLNNEVESKSHINLELISKIDTLLLGISLSFVHNGEVESTCLPNIYNSAEGHVAYTCNTTGGKSGSLITDPSQKPFAIHLGIQNGKGYGLVLASYRSNLLSILEAKNP